ncbi:MAG: sigma-54 dependent transcriptional regulator [Gammaproteobacteria bacterium]
MSDTDPQQSTEKYPAAHPSTGGMIGNSAPMIELFRRIARVALTDSAVLITGEIGTGKERVAKALHDSSVRKDGKLVTVNCASIPENLIEAELFGYEEDAVPGTSEAKAGLVETADGGTLFLDEIGDLPLSAQARLLQVIKDNEIRRLGSLQPLKVDVRLVAATHKHLQRLVGKGEFREDLLYRINVMQLEIPPLRERGPDILELAEIKLNEYCLDRNIPAKHFTTEAIPVITSYTWPGNVRELENAIERAVTLPEDIEIPLDHLGLNTHDGLINPSDSSEPPEKDMSLKDYFQKFVLEHQGHLNETELAKKLGISRKCLWERRQRFNIPRKKKTS